MRLGHGGEYLACWLEAELITDIKRELAVLRQMLPDARITGSMLLPRWVWVGARKVTAVDKIRRVVNHEAVSMGRLLEGQALLGRGWQCRGVPGPQRTGELGRLSSGRPCGLGARVSGAAAGTCSELDAAQPCGLWKASDRIRVSMEITIDDLFPGPWEAFMGRDCVDMSVSRSSWNQSR